MANDNLRCTRCDGRGEKWVMHTNACYDETRRIVAEEFAKIEGESATVGELLLASISAAKEAAGPFGFGFGRFGTAGLRVAQDILRGRGLPTGEPDIETLSPEER